MPNPTPIIAQDHPHLRGLIEEAIKTLGPTCDLNHIDVSKIGEFYQTFKDTQFNGDISRWNVSSSTVFSELFSACPFNGDISQWDVSNATYMSRAFAGSQFNGDISRWDVRRVTNAESMFSESAFDGDISSWTFSPTTEAHDFRGMVAHARPTAKRQLRLPPDLPAPVTDLFWTHALMLDWLAQAPIGRYHWDALLFHPEYFPGKYGLPQEMQDYAKVYRDVNPDAQESYDIGHSRIVARSWGQRLASTEQLPLPPDLHAAP